MTNIYNKTRIVKNQTLIDNWYEEEILREQTGISRSLAGTNHALRSFDPEVYHPSTEPVLDTYKRVIGKKEEDKSYKTTNETYGNHPHPELKYMHQRLHADLERKLFNDFMSTSRTYQSQINNAKADFRSFDTTTKSELPLQPRISYVGLRHMLTQDMKPIPYERAVSLIPIEKLKKLGAAAEEAQQKMNEGSPDAEEAVKEALKEDGDFWMKHINSGNVYRSFTKNPNPWARSSAFTQKLARTRGAIQYYQNAKNDDVKTEEMLEEERRKEEEKRKEEERKKREEEERNKGKYDFKNIILDADSPENINKLKEMFPEDIKNKIIEGCKKRGWVGLRMLKIYLRGVSRNKSDCMDRTNFKFHMARNAIELTDKEIDKIYEIFDFYKADSINFITMLNCLRKVNYSRINLIECFLLQVRDIILDVIFFGNMVKKCDMNYHPEAMKFFKTAPEIEHDYLISWDNLKEDDRVTYQQFREYFYDISTCVDDDEDFTQILKSLGFY